MGLQHAKLWNVSVQPAKKVVEVLFNPGEYGIDRGASYAELPVPGLGTPILQFVRGEADTLAVELFLDATDERRTVEDELTKLRSFVAVDKDLHAPPVCKFEWGVTTFQGVVTSLKEKFQLFDTDGQVIRARVTLSLKRYQPVEVQLRTLTLQSPDRTRMRVLREGETLAQLAHEAYGNGRLWRVIAEANGIERPRFVRPGTPLRLPSL